ncbi:peptidylprolyl isomerase [Candidatus Nitrotoga sp. AM1P]|uniref:peptidylprolyl isomerase n=1 Tax=Candidatus Nitrotoga sp. AM1P TaxID=2559597 RepID=UPI0010B08DD9|nr:peptidylprolyl isomerase [Candidatus Nitrotoga sp. AM1P]BBJ23779.1 chaperone SurA [Candidatus Nitrotoga sp. AM1P]
MLHIKLVLALLLSLACTANVSAAGLQKTSGTTKKIKAQTQTAPSTTPAPSANPAPNVPTPDTAKKLSSQNQTLPPAVDLQTPDITKKITVQTAPILIDQIVAVVNNDAITRYELEDRLGIVERQLKKQGTALPDIDMLKKQLLERMITEMLQVQFAKETGIRIDDIQLDKTMQRIAKENKFPSLTEFRAQLEKENVNFKKFREEIRGEIIYARLREREVDSKLVISEGEVDNYLNNQAKQLGKGEEFHLAHILVLVPEQASADKIQATRQRADQALAQLRGGAEFAQVAAGFSDAKDALEGGNLGWRSADRTPAIFLNVLRKMAPGETSPVFRSPNGFHILKLIEKRSKENSVVITQTEARHILIKTSELVPENEAKSRLLVIKQRIEKGADFTKQAKLYSEDGSAAKGGDLGWISPGDTVPEFEAAMNQLEIGQMSGAVQSTFGWHLIQVLDRRSTDVSVKEKKKQAQMAIRADKSDAAYQDWLRQLRDGATIEYRLEPAL